MSSPVKKSNIFSSDNTKKYDRQVGFLATVEQFHFYLVANRFSVKLTRNLVSWAAGADLGGRVQGVRTTPTPEMTCSFLIQVVFWEKKNYVVYWC